jgi:hypothetical protein
MAKIVEDTLRVAVDKWLKDLDGLDSEFLDYTKSAIDDGDWSRIVEDYYDDVLNPGGLEAFILEGLNDLLENIEVSVKFPKVEKSDK